MAKTSDEGLIKGWCVPVVGGVWTLTLILVLIAKLYASIQINLLKGRRAASGWNAV
jgi:hypothetical protein